jgi:squalene-hopene/tetraprenyl-beta-curcumene cyclase
MAWHELRHPFFFSSDECATALGVLALLTAAETGDAEAIAARDRGITWLSGHATDDDPQTLALRTILWSKLGRPSEESRQFIERIRARQNADGGWSQTTEMASDAWATGQALYALAASGAPADDPALAHAQQFLISTQREDGGWPMTSRPMKPGGEGSKSLIPITGGGSAWAVLGLVQSAQ